MNNEYQIYTIQTNFNKQSTLHTKFALKHEYSQEQRLLNE